MVAISPKIIRLGPHMSDFAVLDGERPDLGGNMRYGDNGTFCPKLWSYLIDRFSIRSMLDVGCGEGHAVHYFRQQNVIAHGIDGLKRNVDRAVTRIALHDLTVVRYYMPVDLVWSCEVAEHISPDKVDTYINTLSNGNIIAMTHALPGQIGHHHVTCQPAEYWIDKMRGVGYDLAPFNDVYRHISGSDAHFNYFTQSGLIFSRCRDGAWMRS